MEIGVFIVLAAAGAALAGGATGCPAGVSFPIILPAV
jgi:hypothetical protein